MSEGFLADIWDWSGSNLACFKTFHQEGALVGWLQLKYVMVWESWGAPNKGHTGQAIKDDVDTGCTGWWGLWTLHAIDALEEYLKFKRVQCGVTWDSSHWWNHDKTGKAEVGVSQYLWSVPKGDTLLGWLEPKQVRPQNALNKDYPSKPAEAKVIQAWSFPGCFTPTLPWHNGWSYSEWWPEVSQEAPP